MTPARSALKSAVWAVYRTGSACKAQVVRLTLGLLTGLVSGLARWLSALYANNWGLLRLTYYDQLYNVLGGPAKWLWVERGYLACRDMTPESVVLDIGCSNGIYAAYFYAPRVKAVDAIDCCLPAIRIAQRRYANIGNLCFAGADVVKDPFPSPRYDVVVCNAVIEYLTPDEIPVVFDKIRLALTSDGVLIGHTPIKPDAASHQFGSTSNINSKDKLIEILSQCFDTVETWPSLETTRTSVYFRCSQPRR